MSVLLRPAIATAHVAQLSLVAGLAATDALDAAAGVAARIRWPNDVLLGGRKLCGILPEARWLPDGRIGHVLLGIGLNVNQAVFPEELDGRATSLRTATGRVHDPERLLSALLEALDRRYGAWLAGGFAAVREDWRGRASTIGQRVRTADGREGVAVDVDGDGGLVVDVGGGALARVVSGALDEEPAWRAVGEDRDAARH